MIQRRGIQNRLGKFKDVKSHPCITASGWLPRMPAKLTPAWFILTHSGQWREGLLSDGSEYGSESDGMDLQYT